ncbi:MAG: hypothetical protein QNJ98_15300 [Planctomycetota bacterium]|nr:hypothetical protein [Planctomycetota bacterium]
MPRTVLAVLCLALLGLPACGGGGGGDSGPALPGTLLALAVEGEPTPAGAPTAGTFAPINVATPLMDAGAGGWVAFVATVNRTIGGLADVLYVAEPNGTIHEVYAVGDQDPTIVGGAITGFSGVWMCDDGTVFASIALTAPAPNLGVVSAQIVGGAVTAKQKVVYQNDFLPGDAINALFGINAVTAQVDGTCTFWFLGTLGNGATGLYSIERDGTGAVRHVVTGQPVLPAAMVAAIDAFNVSRNGAYYGCVIDVGGGNRNIYSAQAGGALQIVAKPGDPCPDSVGTFVAVWKLGASIYVSPSGQLVFVGVGDQAATDDLLVLMAPLNLADLVLARTGGAPNAQLPESYQNLTLVSQRLEGGSFPQFVATLTGGPVAVSVYAYDFQFLTPNRYVFNGRSYVGGGVFTGALPGLTTPPLRVANRDISFAFRDQLDTGATGVFWAFRTQAPLAAALEGGAALGGTDTFGSFLGTAHTTENGVVVFTALLTNAGTGLFRQG